MKIIKPNVQEITDFEGVDNFYHAVARAARVCYASNKTDNDKKLVERLIESKHFSPFEHAIIYLDFNKAYYNHIYDIFTDHILNFIYKNKYTIYFKKENIVAVNGRILIEGIKDFEETYNLKCYNIEEIFEQLIDAVINTHKFKSFIVDTSIGCTREMNRHHDNFYICEQSTRYVNFSKNKFGNEVAFNKPYWYDTKNSVYKAYWTAAMENAEMLYMTAVKNIPEDLKNCSDSEFGMGFHIDEARGILPLDTHTRAIYTATIEEWQHIIDLRLKGTTGKPHGDIMVIASKINELL